MDDSSAELESVARDLCLKDDIDPDGIDHRPPRAPEKNWKRYRERARIAVFLGKDVA